MIYLSNSYPTKVDEDKLVSFNLTSKINLF